MAALFTKSCQYAIQAVLYLARSKPAGSSVHVQEISERLGIPRHFLGKVLQLLAHHGIVTSQKGMRGGFHLARHPRKITVMDIVAAIDGPAFFGDCIFGFPGCGEVKPCTMHEMWKGQKEGLLEILRRRTIEDLSLQMEERLNIPRNQPALERTDTP
jgi:Rrf2 family iron-sulfur cluster assembly transcriptional regulator